MGNFLLTALCLFLPFRAQFLRSHGADKAQTAFKMNL